MRNILMGVAAIALAAGSAHAQPGNGKGNGNDKGNGGGNAAAASKNAGGGNSAKADKSQGNAKRMAQANPGNGGGNGNAKVKTGNGNGNGNAAVRYNDKGNGNGNAKSDIRRNVANVGKSNGNNGNGNGKANKIDARDLRDRGQYFSYATRNTMARDYGLIDGCPPGLAKKRNGCNPPGLVKRDEYGYDRSSWWGLPGLTDGRYRYYDNNLVRLSPTGSILGYYPLLGGALSAGNVWPTWFDYEPVPSYYESYYGLGPSGSYRYADNVLYRVDPQTSAISSIAALLTGDTIQVGQPMPLGYDVYNVPYGYRDRYYDSPNANYRYSDGYVYEIDPTTQLVAAAIELLI